MTPGCTNPKAFNYNASADTEDYSCLYILKDGSNCHAFIDVPPGDVTEKSYTLSFGLESKDWIFFHDYIPDFYFSTRDKLFNLKNSHIFRNNEGAPGVYHDSTPRSFFIDAVFRDAEMTLNTLQWISEILNAGAEEEFSTLTHLTVWTNQQCTGRIALSDVFSSLEYQRRKLQSIWSFDDFRDVVAVRGTQFLNDIFSNFAVDPDQLSATLPWYDQSLLENDWFMVRFEFDNTSGKQILLHEIDINASKSYR